MASPKLSPLQHQTKTQVLRTQLLELARNLGPGAKLPTMRELCDSLQVSGMTLNRALSELEAQGVINRRQGSGTYVAATYGTPRTTERTVGLVYDRDIFAAGNSPFTGLLVDEARRRAAGHERFSFYLAVPSKDNLPVHDDLAEAVRERRLHGVLFVGEQNPGALQWLLGQNVPVVALAYTPIAPWRVKIDHAAGIRSGVRALAEQGCRHIGLWIPVGVGIGRAAGAESFTELDAFRTALEEHGLAFEPERVWQHQNLTDVVPPQPADTNQEQGYRAALQVFGNSGTTQQERPDGLVIDDDMMTRGALVALQQAGIRLGTDVKIATHINRGSEVLLGYEDHLSLIEVDPGEIVEAMFSMLETLMDGGTPPLPTVSIQPKLRS
jgi:DNA-binding LacI/PurR family transcriptional regulator